MPFRFPFPFDMVNTVSPSNEKQNELTSSELTFYYIQLHCVSERSHLTPGNITSPLSIHSRPSKRGEKYTFSISLGLISISAQQMSRRVRLKAKFTSYLGNSGSEVQPPPWPLSSKNTSSSSALAVNAAQILPHAADSEWFCKIKSVKQKRRVVLWD